MDTQQIGDSLDTFWDKGERTQARIISHYFLKWPPFATPKTGYKWVRALVLENWIRLRPIWVRQLSVLESSMPHRRKIYPSYQPHPHSIEGLLIFPIYKAFTDASSDPYLPRLVNLHKIQLNHLTACKHWYYILDSC